MLRYLCKLTDEREKISVNVEKDHLVKFIIVYDKNS